ncbi:MAG: ORF6N domain-containing protein [Gammaproteobacteria bacterium]|jgi:hypothetical protein
MPFLASKFPDGYIIDLTNLEWKEVRSQIVTSPLPLGDGRTYKPKAFTERGLYMLATSLDTYSPINYHNLASTQRAMTIYIIIYMRA